MGWLSRLFGYADLPNQTYPTTGIASPWSSGDTLVPIVAADVLGLVEGDDGVTRATAMKVPAVARGRGLVTSLCRYPVKAYQGAELVRDQPTWLYRTDYPQQPRERMRWLLDDALFYGHALLVVDRGAKQNGQAWAPILDARRVPPARWKLDEKGVHLADSKGHFRLLDPSEYIYIPGPQDALLDAGSLAIRTALAIQRGTAARAASPTPIINLQLEEGVLESEARSVQAEWAKARQAPNGAVAVTTPGITAQEMGNGAMDFMEAARNASRLDVANVIGIPASELDGSLATATLTYSTAEGNRNRLHDSLVQWQTAFEDALSADNVVPRGQRVAFDLEELYGPPTATGPVLED